MAKLTRAIALLFSVSSASVAALQNDHRIGVGGRALNEFRELAALRSNKIETNDAESKLPYQTHKLSIPIDHFHSEPEYEPHTSDKFSNRYWFDASHYQPGGPVIVLLGGETDGANRIPFLQDGILAQLAEATNGIGVVLEHRYYGDSFPTSDLSIEELRFLKTEQAMADVAYFAQNIEFAGLEKYGDLTARSVPWITYGGSYAGAFSAFLRVEYPDIFWGAISSSGVTEVRSVINTTTYWPIYDYWQYFSPAAKFGPPACISAQKLFTDAFDNIYNKGDRTVIETLKKAFGLPNVTHTTDFANLLSSGVGLWQSLNWDPAVTYDGFYWFCNNISSTEVLTPHVESKRRVAEDLLSEGGYTPNATIVNQLLNYIGWMDENVVAPCTAKGLTQDQCFSTHNSTFYQQDDRDQWEWRSWAYQYCTEWGYLATGSGVPKDQQGLISRTIDLEHMSRVCREGFNLTEPGDPSKLTKYGGYDISHPRLAFVDGQWDPWLPATPHAYENGAHHRTSTTSEPFILIPQALHHYDENGVPANETSKTFPPPAVQKAQAAEREFVQRWVEEWRESRGWGWKEDI